MSVCPTDLENGFENALELYNAVGNVEKRIVILKVLKIS